jgi:DNA-3-methyladenine glycosylase
LTNGPGKFCAALEISREHNAVDLTDPHSPLFLAENPGRAALLNALGPLKTAPRIGITQAADWPLRFYLAGSEFVSRRSKD